MNIKELKEAFKCLLEEHTDKDYEHRDVIEHTRDMILAYFTEDFKDIK